jgi:hypothetical protein
MSEERPDWSRRKLVQYSGVGIALAVAGCNGAGDSSGEGDDNGLPKDSADAFELAGDGSAGFREWLGPEFTLESRADGEQRQLFQFVDYEEIPDGEMQQQRDQRANFAEQIGAAPESIERELLLGPITDNLPYRALFGSFDAAALVDSFENEGFERTGEPGDFVIFDESFAISGDTIIEHPSSATLIERMMSGQQSFEGIDEEMELVLDLVPAGPQTTITSRGDHDDVVLDGLTIFELNGPVVTRGIRTLIFEDESAATSERVREIDIDGSARNEVVTEEIRGRVAMIESRRAE